MDNLNTLGNFPLLVGQDYRGEKLPNIFPYLRDPRILLVKNMHYIFGRFRPLHINHVRGQKLNPNFFYSNFSGASGISRQNPGISRKKSLIPWVSRNMPNLSAPTPSRGRPPPHQKISRLKSLGLGSLFVPDMYATISARVALALIESNFLYTSQVPGVYSQRDTQTASGHLLPMPSRHLLSFLEGTLDDRESPQQGICPLSGRICL